jgi:hypothetical protein
MDWKSDESEEYISQITFVIFMVCFGWFEMPVC